MPFGLDLTRSIVNVQWGGGIFVVAYQWFGTNPSSNVWTSDAQGKQWQKTFSTPANSSGFRVSAFPGGGVHGMISIADAADRPIFVLGGRDGDTGGAMFLNSSDGKKWSSKSQSADDGEVYLLTWDEDAKTFYAGMWLLTQDGTGYDVALKSTDGTNWTEVTRVVTVPGYRPPVERFCSDKIKDRNGNRVPTSVFGYNKGSDTLIAPEPIDMTFGQGYTTTGTELKHGLQLKIIRGPANDSPGTDIISLPSGMSRVWAVGYVGSIWQAVGEMPSGSFASGVVATSNDVGLNWEKTLTESPGSSFTAVAAGQTASPASSGR